MAAGLINLVKGLALRETKKVPLKTGETIVYRPARTLMKLSFLSIGLGIFLLAYYTVTPNLTASIYLLLTSILFKSLGVLLFIISKQETIYQTGNILIKKRLFRKNKTINITDITNVLNFKHSDRIILQTKTDTIKVSKYLIGIHELISNIDK